MEVDVYKNLHKDTWSIRDRRTGRVIEHSDVVHIDDATFVVQPAGRRRVLQERRKNVHAFVRGKWIISSWTVRQEFANPKEVVYNPYESDQFRLKDSGKPFAFLLVGQQM